MNMVQLARLKLQHVLTALSRQCAVKLVRRWVSKTYNMLISNSHMQWVILPPGTDTAPCADCIGGSVCRWVGETVS